MNPHSGTPGFPFAAIVGQEEMKLALILNVIDPGIGGLLVMGHRGTAKSTAVRGLAELMPPLRVVRGCPFNCDPDLPAPACPVCSVPGAVRMADSVSVPVVDLPLGATEDRVAGTLDLEAALVHGRKRFEPGLLARAHRGFLYIDEVNLLEDHLVDLLLDVAAMGENVVERESVSVRHPARFVLVGTGNPEEGELRPQLTDRFGLACAVTTEAEPERRREIVRRRLRFDHEPDAFRAACEPETAALRERIAAAQRRVPSVRLPDPLLVAIADLNAALTIDGHRGELALARAARALAAWEGRDEVRAADVRTAAPPALRHRLRRDPLEVRDLSHRIADAVRSLFGE